LNAALLRGWLEYLRGAVETGQVWIATHVLEAAEAAGLDATLVLERADDRVVRSVAPLGNRPALRTLAGQLGSPAFSVGTSRFLLIEGDRPGRERERFTRVLDSPPRDRFLESGGHREVLTKLGTLRALASEEEQLQIGGFVDRDFRTDEEAAALETEYGVCVLPVHEIENFFLQPELLGALVAQADGDPQTAFDRLVDVTDAAAGLWIWERARQQQRWEGDLGPAQQVARTLTWVDVEPDARAALQSVVDAVPNLSAADQVRWRAALVSSAEAYRTLRGDSASLWKHCFGKEALRDLAPALGAANAEAVEDRAVRLWRTGAVGRPAELAVMREYLAGVPVLS
jgi:hypothetical protein